MLFDVDGTPVDAAGLPTLARRRGLREVGEIRPVADLHRLVGVGSERLLDEVLGATRVRDKRRAVEVQSRGR